MLLALTVAPASAQTTFSVSSSSACTLANAITAANTDAVSGSCAAGSGADIINITSDITLTADLPNIASAMTIQGSGARRTIDGANSHRAFDIRVGGYSVTINDLTLDKMQSPAGSGTDAVGAAILSAPLSGGRVTLELNRVTISNSSAWYSGNTGHSGAMAVGWTNLTINDSVFDGNRGTTSGAMQVSGNVTATINRSVFRNNVAQIYGGAIRLFGGTVTVNNSSFYNNTVENSHASTQGYGGAIEVDDGGTLNLNHVTITGNTVKNATSNRGGGLANILVSSTTTVRVRNSIIFGNTPEDCYQTVALSVNTGNIIGTGNCGAGTNGSNQDPGLRGPENGNFIPRAGGPAINAVACLTSTVTNKWNEDQRGQTRPNPAGGQCDIGAIEDPGWSPPPPPPPPPPPQPVGPVGPVGPGGPGGSGASGGALGGIGISPAESCENLAPAVVVGKADGGTACQRVRSAGYGHPDLVAARPVSVVDLWGTVQAGTEVCFQAAGGSLGYVDTGAMPRSYSTLTSYSRDGLLCATIGGPGQVALIADGSAPTGQAPAQVAQDAEWQGLGGCLVKTESTLNFRKSPAGERQEFTDPWGNANAGWLPGGVTLTALERSGNWLKVDYYGTQGWVSASYVTTSGSCG